MNNEETKIPLFRRCVLQNFPFIEQDFDALTDYALLCKVVEYLNIVITATNENSAQVEALTNAFNNLKNYVDHYFDNLDVQEEINNKLDKMAQDGSLTELIGNYCDPKFQEQNANIELFKTSVNEQIGELTNEIQSAVSGSPLVASSTAEMTDTTRVYVNTTDGKWYYYDGDSWEIGGTYQSTGIADNSINYMMVDSITDTIHNESVPTYTTNEGYIKPNGSIVADANYRYTSGIALKSGQTIVCYSRGSTSVAVISWLHDDSSYERLVSPTDTTAKYFTYTATQDMNVVLCGHVDTLGKVKIVTALGLTQAKDYNDGILVGYPDVENIMIKYDDGIAYTNQNTFKATDFLPLANADSITITALAQMGPDDTTSGIAFYDKNKSYISGEQLGNLKTKTVSIPEGAFYCRYSTKKYAGSVEARYNHIITALAKSVYRLDSENNEEQLYDLSLFPSVCVIGDSYANGVFCETNGGDLHNHPTMSYPAMLARKYGFTLSNISIGGMSTRSFINGDKWDDLVNDSAKNLYLLALERNDITYYGEHPDYLGNITDITSHSLGNYPDTFYGNYATIIETIMNKDSDVKIIMLTIAKHGNATTTAFNNAMKAIAEHYSIPVIEEDDDSYFNSTLFTENRPGSGHPGAVQYNGMGNAIARLINNCLITNITYFKYTNPV